MRLGRGERGANVVEMALVMVFLLLLAAGIVDLGRAYHTYIVMMNAAREGARWGSHYPWDESGIIDATRQEASEGAVDLSAGTITVHGLNGTGGEPIGVTVVVPYPTILAGLTGIGSLNLSTSAQMIIFGLDPP
jgi:Flp pilus assembly protein TadG